MNLGRLLQKRKKYSNPHSIHIYIDSHKTITVVTFYYYEDTPMGVDIGEYQTVNAPYDPEKLGEVILSCYEKARHKPSVTDAQRAEASPSFEKITGKGFSYWLRRHECIEITFHEQVRIQYMHKEISGGDRGYSSHMEEQNETEIILSPDASAKEIGDAVDAVYFRKMTKG